LNELLAFWADWTKPSAGLPTLQWSLLLAVAAAAGHLIQRHIGLPKVAGYALVGTFAGLAGFSGTRWPLEGTGLFLLELGIAVVLFEAGARISLRWFRHNPMVLVQSAVESAATFAAVYFVLRLFDISEAVAEPLALISVAASPAVLTRVVMDTRASGPVTERAIVLSTLNTLYALTIGTAMAGLLGGAQNTALTAALYPVASVLGLSFVVAAVMALAMRAALLVMNPTSENTSMLLLALIAAGAALAAHLGGSAALSALLGGLLLKQLNPRPWAWPRQLGTAASLLTMLMFVLVSTMAAQADWSGAVAGLVAAVVATRLAARILGLMTASFGSGMRLKQVLWVGCAMSPMSSVALLLTSQFATASKALGPAISGTALPAILLMEVLGAVMATVALYRAGESSKPQMFGASPFDTSGSGELR
jgi:Kef-type K+ transport system membrane component KefB